MSTVALKEPLADCKPTCNPALLLPWERTLAPGKAGFPVGPVRLRASVMASPTLLSPLSPLPNKSSISSVVSQSIVASANNSEIRQSILICTGAKSTFSRKSMAKAASHGSAHFMINWFIAGERLVLYSS